MTPLRIGVLRLADNAPVVVAEARGLAAAQGLELIVSVEPSWANIADKLAWGGLDAAVMLPPLVLATASGLRGPGARLVVPMGLSQGGNSMVAAAGIVAAPPGDAVAAGRDFLAWLRTQARPRFAVVHAFSTHNLLFRYWLAACGGDPDRDVEIVALPPQDVVAALRRRRISGFCAGAPWGGEAEAEGGGNVLFGTSAIWPRHPEKCLAVAAAWAEAWPRALTGLLRALLQAQLLCDDPAEAQDIAALLAHRLGLPRAATRAALPGGDAAEVISFAASAMPWRSQAEWFLGQMGRWGWLDPGRDLAAIAQATYRPELLAPAAEALALPPEPVIRLFDAGGLR